MTQFNLKKKKSREKFFFDKNNIISEIGNELIFDKVSFIKKDLEQVLVIDNYELKDHPKILDYQYSEFEEIGEKNSFDGILSNFKVHIPLILLKLIYYFFPLPNKLLNFIFLTSSRVSYNNKKIKKDLNFKPRFSLLQNIKNLNE